jgi:molecular chaperone Hsp33
MDELHKFLFEGLPVRGMLVRLEGSWQDLMRRREPAHGGSGPFDPPLRALLGEMVAAGVLMQSNIKFNGALILQVQGDGPVKLAVAEAQPDLSFRATASLRADARLPADADLASMLNPNGQGRCAITLDPRDRLPGQQPYQGIVPLHGDHGEPLHALSEVLEHYMLQSEQLDTRLILAADDRVAAGLLIQRMPLEGEGNLASTRRREDDIGLDEDFNRIAHLAASLQRAELLQLDPLTVLHRLFWQENVLRQVPQTPRFACTCSRQRVVGMLRGLGRAEVEDILSEQGQVDIGCEFCGQHYRFDAVDVGEVFTPRADQAPGSGALN